MELEAEESIAFVWFKRCGAATLWCREPGLFAACCAGSHLVEPQHRSDIRHDCARCGSMCDSADQVKALERILLAFAFHSPCVGYCQGMSTIVETMLKFCDSQSFTFDNEIVIKAEEVAFFLLVHVVHVLFPSFFGSQLSGIDSGSCIFVTQLEKLAPSVFKRMSALGLASGGEPAIYVAGLLTMPWFVTIFSNCLPLATLSLVWDVIFSEEADRSQTLPLSALIACGLTLLLIHDAFDPLADSSMLTCDDDDSTQNVLNYVNAVSDCAEACCLTAFQAIWERSLKSVDLEIQRTTVIDRERKRAVTAEAQARLSRARALLWSEVDRQDDLALSVLCQPNETTLTEDIKALESAISHYDAILQS